MGMTNSRLERNLTSLPDEERYFGLENFGNTCYCNSVLQALYFCTPFREGVLEFAESIDRDTEENVYTCLAELFSQIYSQRKKSGVISPKKFVQRLKRDNDQFCGFMHQDAHEFLIYLFLQISEILEKQQKNNHQSSVDSITEDHTQAETGSDAESAKCELEPTWVQKIFEGKLVHETKCLQCETVTSREEVFMDLQLPIEHNCSLTSCLKRYSAKTILDKRDKYFCEVCQCHQEAYRQNKIKHLPEILICHLMRFDERMRKLMYRVVFPMELKLCNTTDDAPTCDDVYNLVAVVVHSGSSINHGHYVSLVKSHGHWLMFDDDHVEAIPESWVERTFGTPANYSKVTDRGYILFYEKSSKREIPSSSSTGHSSLVPDPDIVTELNGVRSHHHGNRTPNKSAGSSETVASKSNTVPFFDSKATRSTSVDSFHRVSSDKYTGIESSSSVPPTNKKQSRSAAFTATLKSFWHGSKTSGLTTSATEERKETVATNLNRSFVDERHVQNAKTNIVKSPGV
eukprot:g6285.t1